MKPLFLGLAILASTVRAIPVNMPHTRAFEETGTASATLSKRQDDWDVWRNELTNVAGVGCKPITVIFARGTIELGNVGDLVGPPFFDDLDDLIGADNIAVQGVDYPATIGGYLIGGVSYVFRALSSWFGLHLESQDMSQEQKAAGTCFTTPI